MPRPSYLPHVDGLRAVAIFLVVIFHTGLDLLSGGFVGVDVFFVLSGFLITGQIAAQINNNRFTFSGFYLRRFRRLLPAYIVVALATLVIGYFILLPKDYVYHVKLMGLAFLSLGNFYLANTTEGYFAEATDEIPLLHTWSLSVEEQFYLLWPILLLMLFRYFKNKNLLIVVSGLFIAAVIFSQWQTLNFHTAAYYLLPARFFELLAGALLALSITHLPVLSSRSALMSGVAGMVAIILSSIYLTQSDYFPGFNALPVSIGTALLIYSGYTKNPMGDILSTRLFVGLGKISYSLYLWHWPIFVFIRYSTGGITPVESVFAILLSVLLSYLTWRYVENPFRFKWKFSFWKTFVSIYAIPLLIFITINIVVDRSDGLPGRFDVDPLTVQALEKKATVYNESCPGVSGEKCAEVMLIGDSHAAHFSPFMHVLLGQNQELKLKTQTGGFCLPMVNMYRAMKNRNNGKITYLDKESDCYKKTNAFYEKLTEKQYKYVALAGYWSIADISPDTIFYFDENNPSLSRETSQKVFRNAFFNSVNALIEKGITPVIIKDNPAISDQLLKCSRHKILDSAYARDCVIEYSEVQKQQELVNNLFAEIEKKFPQVKFIAPADVICNENHCATIFNGMPLYLDKQHLTDIGSRILGEQYLLEKGSPFP